MTLLEGLRRAAIRWDERAADADEAGDSEMRDDYHAVAEAFRAQALRFRFEWTRANTRWHDTTSTACRSMLERINGGPVSHG
jgi:hypothetical protein